MAVVGVGIVVEENKRRWRKGAVAWNVGSDSQWGWAGVSA